VRQVQLGQFSVALATYPRLSYVEGRLCDAFMDVGPRDRALCSVQRHTEEGSCGLTHSVSVFDNITRVTVFNKLETADLQHAWLLGRTKQHVCRSIKRLPYKAASSRSKTQPYRRVAVALAVHNKLGCFQRTQSFYASILLRAHKQLAGTVRKLPFHARNRLQKVLLYDYDTCSCLYMEPAAAE